MKVLDFAPFRGSYVREFELSHSNLVNRIIKITHPHNLHVKMLVFGPFTIGHFTLVDGSEAEGDLVLIQTFLLYYVNQVILKLTSIFQEQFP